MYAAALAMSPKVRRWVYAVIGGVSLVVGACQVGYASLDAGQPEWLTVALAVVPFLAAGLGYTAASHTPSEVTTVQPAKHRDEDSDGVADVYTGDSKRDATYHPNGGGGYMDGQ